MAREERKFKDAPFLLKLLTGVGLAFFFIALLGLGVIMSVEGKWYYGVVWMACWLGVSGLGLAVIAWMNIVDWADHKSRDW